MGDAIYARPLEALIEERKLSLVKRAFQIARWDRSIISQIDVAEQSHFQPVKAQNSADSLVSVRP